MAFNFKHVMELTKIRVLEATFALIRKGISNVIEYNDCHPDLLISSDILIKYMLKWSIFCVMWGVAGSMTLADR
jgi:hypothetical protein